MNSGEGLFVEPRHGIVELHVCRWMSGGKLRCDGCVDLRLDFRSTEIRRWNVQFLRLLRQWRDAMIGGERDPHVGQADLMAEKIDELGKLPVKIERHLVHF